MLLPLSWLQEYLPKLPSPKALAELLDMHGLEVEKIIDRSHDFDNVVVGEIIAIKAHPNADKLRLANVIIKKGGQPLEIVCGAPNIEVGQKVPVALLGAQLPNGITIEKRAIRGVESNGMLCAADELGISNDHAGVMVLDATAKVGSSIVQALGLDEIIFDIAVPANRVDLMSVRGLAREISVIIGKPVRFPITKLKISSKKSSVTISVTDKKLSPIYIARTIRGIIVTGSPTWLKQKLQAAGMRPINTVVDVANYTMLEYGQPLHAFDAAKVKGGLTVRPAKSGEHLMTLDGVDRKLDASMLVIADTSGPIALAGVMGGQSTAVTDTTTDIILESAIFHSVAVRKTSRQFGLISEASKRFERGLWTTLPQEASDAASVLVTQVCGGVADKIVSVGKSVQTPVTITMKPAYIGQRLGMTVSPAKAKTILTQLGYKVAGSASWKITVPVWRGDVTMADDMVDEIGRSIGYDKLPKKMPPMNDAPGPLPTMVQWKDELRQVLLTLGCTEVMTHSYYGAKDESTVTGEHVEVANPLDAGQQFLRRSLLPATSKILVAASDAGRDAKIFEISRVFTSADVKKLPTSQPWKLVIGVALKTGEGYTSKHLITSLGEELYHALNIVNEFLPEDHVTVDHKNKGRTIEIVELDIQQLLKLRQGKGKIQVDKYPAITRDISFWWPKDEAELQSTIRQVHLELLRKYKITDRFSKDGRTSYAVSFVYQSTERTLLKEEVDQMEAKIRAALIQHGATIR